jgi:VWA domain-containing protein
VSAGIPFGDHRRLGGPARRALLATAVLGLAIVVLALVAVASSATGGIERVGFVDPKAATVVVLDGSFSISGLSGRIAGNAVHKIASTNRPIGLVAFSDAAYQLLPLGTPARELFPYVRFFRASAMSNPLVALRGGTQISTGLDLARDVLDRAGVTAGTIVLISDLEDAQDDLPRVEASIAELRRRELELRIVPLLPSGPARSRFEALAGRGAFVPIERLRGHVPAGRDSLLEEPTPWLFLVVAAGLIVLMAANERFAGRLA